MTEQKQEEERIVVVVFRTAVGRTLYRQVPGAASIGDVDVPTLIKEDSGRRVLRGDPVRGAQVMDLTPEQYAAIPEANPTWVEIRDGQ